MAGTTGLEPATSAVTGQRSNQLSYVPNFNCGALGAPAAAEAALKQTITDPARARHNKNVQSRKHPGVPGHRTRHMRLAIFGLALSSSWGNGHATLWRGLLRALAEAGHRMTFFEKDVPYYAAHRDGWPQPRNVDLALYTSLDEDAPRIARVLSECDAAIVTSYCPEGAAVCDLVLGAGVPFTCFYDLDTPVTLDALDSGQAVDYLPTQGLGGFDLVLSYTGGRALKALRERLGARYVAPLYGFVDPEAHRRAEAHSAYAADLSYLGTYAADRQPRLRELFLEPARSLPEQRFLIGGAMYPPEFPWGRNIYFVHHVPPEMHPAFFSSSRLTLNITRAAMAAYGWCPSGRLFEAAACGAPLLSDVWEGLNAFFTPGEEILLAQTSADTLAALERTPDELGRMAARARERVLAEHTAAHRARQLEELFSRTAAAV